MTSEQLKIEHVTLEQDIQSTWLKHGLRVTKETVKGHTWIIEAERIKPIEDVDHWYE